MPIMVVNHFGNAQKQDPRESGGHLSIIDVEDEPRDETDGTGLGVHAPSD